MDARISSGILTAVLAAWFPSVHLASDDPTGGEASQSLHARTSCNKVFGVSWTLGGG